MKILTIIFLAVSTLYANDIHFEADHLDFDNRVFLLENNVKIEHPLAKCSSNYAEIRKGLTHQYNTINFKENVHLQLSNYGALSSDQGELNLQNLYGCFEGVKHPVTYLDTVFFEGEQTPFILKCKSLKFKLLPKKNLYKINDIVAHKHVAIHLGQDLSAFAHLAKFHSISSTQDKDYPLGIIELFPKTKNDFCKLTKQDDVIYAKKMIFDTNRGEITLSNAEGSLHSTFQKSKMDFKAKQLRWDHASEILTLENNIIINDDAFGTIHADDTIKIMQSKRLRSSQFSKIISLGPTKLNISSNFKKCSFISYGQTIVDTESRYVSSSSPKSGKHTPLDKQVCYAQEGLIIYANQARMDYQLDNETIKPTEILFSNDVRIYLKGEERPFDSAFAYEVKYIIEKNEIQLFSKASERVLFHKPEEKMCMSCEKLIIRRDMDTKKDHLNAMGHVRMYFEQEEKNLYKKFFKSPPH